MIREAMKKKGMVALGPAGDEHRERICAIEIEESGLLMTTLPMPDPQMLAIAEKIVDQQAGEFESCRVRRSLRGCAARVDRETTAT